MYTKSLALAALAAAPALATPAVNVYFGQSGTDSLASYCETNSFEYVTVAFVNNSPEQDPSGLNYPGTNFGAHCAAEVYTKNGKKSNLLSQCTFIAEDIPKCQALGKKVLLSVGGEWNPPTTNYTVSSPAKGVEFAKFLWGSFGPYDPTYPGPRPFDFNGNHVSVDGFDMDIEKKFDDQSGYIALIQTLRALYATVEGEYLISGAPQCPLTDQYFDMKDMIVHAKFDILWIQFYNNEQCDALHGGFNYDAWELFLKDTQSKDAKLFIGLPATPGSSGYLTPDKAIALLEEYKNRTSFGGAMIWDVASGSYKLDTGKTYVETIHDALCPAPPAQPTATETAEPTATATATETDEPTATATATETDEPTATATATETDEPTGTATATETGEPTGTETVEPTATATDAYPTGTETATATDSYPTASETDDYCDDEPTDTATDAYPTATGTITGTVTGTASATDSYPTASDTESYCDDDEPTDTYPVNTATETGYPTGTETSGSYPTGTESVTESGYPTGTESSGPYPTGTESATETGYPTGTESATETGYPTGTESSGSYPTGTESVTESGYPTASQSMTTSTVYTTSVHTITSCAPTVTNCPVGHVTTETIALYTTVCPVTETEGPVTYDVTATVAPVVSTPVYTAVPVPTNSEAETETYPATSVPETSAGPESSAAYPETSAAVPETSAAYIPSSAPYSQFTTVTVPTGAATYPASEVPVPTSAEEQPQPTPTFATSVVLSIPSTSAYPSQPPVIVSGAGRNVVALAVPAMVAVAALVL